VGLVFLAPASLAQQQQPLEITSEPRHHGGFAWVGAGITRARANSIFRPAEFATLEFKPEQQKQ